MKRPAPSALYDWSMAVASLWASGGILLDAWHHFHSTVETYFEWSHAVLAAGLLAAFVFTGIAVRHFHRQGYPWDRALPDGYDWTLSGLGVFLLSVTHLMIGAGIVLMIAGPIRSAMLRERQPRTLVEQLPMILSLASLIELIHWGTQFVYLSEAESMNAPLNPGLFPHDTFTLLALLYYKQGIGLLAVIVQSLLMVGPALYIARRVTLAPGALTVLFFTGNLFIALVHSNYPGQFLAVIAASLIAGALGDWLRPNAAATATRWGLAAFVMPASYWTVMLVVLAVTMNGIWWSPDVITGSVVMAGAAGLFVNMLTSPPAPARA
jgi:hypothetical protein